MKPSRGSAFSRPPRTPPDIVNRLVSGNRRRSRARPPCANSLTSLGAEAVGEHAGGIRCGHRPGHREMDTAGARRSASRSIDSTASGEAHDVPYRSDGTGRRQRLRRKRTGRLSAVTTDAGTTGWGECSLNRWEPLLVALRARFSREICVGDDVACAADELVRYLPHSPGGLVAHAVKSALEQALTDVSAQLAEKAIHRIARAPAPTDIDARLCQHQSRRRGRDRPKASPTRPAAQSPPATRASSLRLSTASSPKMPE